ncbi:DUF4373 domain-containing protein [uncultured Ruminococcus sp.]|uniref:DUF4373 domain-containing protein n=1 Tax=uncultured Ruminococcus sp. TaxID=165186 RepID=UPI0025FC46DD|nr:DUF4373 domain-containing protein [uncultured Ruminococcus sp.]
MAGQPKRGLDFAAWDVHIFDDDERFDVLIDAQGWSGFGVFFYICTKAYATNGYYYEWREKTSAAAIAKRMSGGIKSDTVKQVVQLCLQIGLFDNGLFDRERILTNKMMQERYMYAIEKRSKRGRTINKDYWLLKEDETKAYIIVPENEHNLSENGNNLAENDTKKSKVNESKEKEKKTDVFISLLLKDESDYQVTFAQLNNLKNIYTLIDVENELVKMSKYFELHPDNRKSLDDIKSYIDRWLLKRSDEVDGIRKNNSKVPAKRRSTGAFNTGEVVL